MKTNYLRIYLLFFVAISPTICFGSVEYKHQKDVVYGYKDGMALVMNVYSPISEKNKAGVIVVIAGGMNSNPLNAQKVGNRADIQNLLNEGYVVFATTHSSQPKYTADEIRYDIPRAVRFIRYNANKFNIEKDKIGIMGASSGGHVSLMAGLSPPPINDNTEDPVDRVSSKIQAVVAFYPSTDLLNFGTENKTILEHFYSVGYKLDAAFDFHYWDDGTKRFERVEDIEKQKKYYRINSPIAYISEDDPPILLIHGDEDKLVPLQQSELLVTKLNEYGIVNKLYVAKGQGHGIGNKLEASINNEVITWFNNHLFD